MPMFAECFRQIGKWSGLIGGEITETLSRADHNPCYENLVDFNADEVGDIQEILKAFETFHVIVLRNAYKDKPAMSGMMETICQVLVALAEKHISARSDAEKESLKKQQISLSDLAASQGRQLDQVLDGWINHNVSDKAFEVISALLGGRPEINISRTTIRKKEGPDSFLLPFHQDARSPSTLSPRVLTCWTPLCNVGEERPGLEIIPVPHSTLLDDDNDENGYRGPKGRIRGPGDDWVTTTYASKIWCPKLNVGDCLIFSGDILHRSQIMEGADTRVSIDLRVFSADNRPEKYAEDISTSLTVG